MRILLITMSTRILSYFSDASILPAIADKASSTSSIQDVQLEAVRALNAIFGTQNVDDDAVHALYASLGLHRATSR